MRNGGVKVERFKVGEDGYEFFEIFFFVWKQFLFSVTFETSFDSQFSCLDV